MIDLTERWIWDELRPQMRLS